MHTPSTPYEIALAARIAQAASRQESLLVQGNATKAAMLRPVQAARDVSASDDAGIVLYSPQELIISARAGTPLPVIEAALAEKGQHLIGEPPDLSNLLGRRDRPQTIGGVTATNLSGPRRVAWGAMRDHVMGLRAVTGRGEVIHSGGRVLKNVTGLDLCKLFTGSHGTLGVITEVTLKVLPAPEQAGTVAIPGLDATRAVAALSAALGSPFGVSAAAWLPADQASRVAALAPLGTSVALARIEDFAASVSYRTTRLAEQLNLPGTAILDHAASVSVWRAVRDAQPMAVRPDDAVWRLSVRPSSAAAIYDSLTHDHPLSGFLDWGGGLIWLVGAATEAAHAAIEDAVTRAGGQWTLMRAPDAMRTAVRVVPDEPAPLARITQRLKQAFDPAGIMNPGRIRAGQ